MEILWAALAIGSIVSAAFYVLALSWRQVLRSHSRAIGALFRRLEALEAMEDPLLRRKIGELMPSPLEQVHILSFCLGDRFWRDTLGATEQQLDDLHEHGTFIGSVKIEVWRSHAAITVKELLPEGKSLGWQTRSVDIYAADSGKPTVLWELCLAREPNRGTVEPPAVELRYENREILLLARTWATGARPDVSPGESAEEKIVFRIPLNAEKLAPFRVPEADEEAGEEENNVTDARFEAQTKRTDAPVSSFSHQDERQGVAWQLRIRNLDGRSAPGQWTILESPQVRRVS